MPRCNADLRELAVTRSAGETGLSELCEGVLGMRSLLFLLVPLCVRLSRPVDGCLLMVGESAGREPCDDLLAGLPFLLPIQLLEV